MQGCVIDLQRYRYRYRATSRERNFTERIKVLIFLEAVLVIEIAPKLEDKDNLSLLKDDFSSKTDPSITMSLARVLLDQSNETI